MKRLAAFAVTEGYAGSLAYWHPNWSRRHAPLLDHIGATIDHLEAHSKGGTSKVDNFLTSCWKCNSRKGNTRAEEFSRRLPPHRIKGKYGEPTDWDGLSALFIVLVQRDLASANATERAWLKAFQDAKDRSQPAP